jgi:hypothetical protein
VVELDAADVILCHRYLLDVYCREVLRGGPSEDEAPGGDVESQVKGG